MNRAFVLRRVQIQGFKSADDVELPLGRLNVLVGANGSGKTNLLEAIGLLGCAASGRVNDDAFRARGVRPGTPALFKTAFADRDRIRRTITLTAESEDALYRVSLDNPIRELSADWRYQGETLSEGGRELGTRSPRGGSIVTEGGQRQKVSPDPQRGLGPIVRPLHGRGRLTALLDALEGFAIYTPFTPMLRGTTPDPAQRSPLGLQGGGLAEATQSLTRREDKRALQRIADEALNLVDWAEKWGWKMTPDLPSTVSPAVSRGKVALLFWDRYMAPKRDMVSAFDASEGALYVLFLLTLVHHPDAPRVAAVDNVDQALNPRLARALIESVQSTLLDDPGTPQLILTTHNPLVLDALRLDDERVRLFIVERDRGGKTIVRRQPYSDLIDKARREGMTLSRLWLSGMLGGMPEL